MNITRNLLLGCVLLTGCAAPMVWTKPGAGQLDFDRDRSECMAQAYRAFPPIHVPEPQPQPSGNFTCIGDRNYMDCRQQPGMVPLDPYGAYQRGAVQAQAEDARNNAARSCMYSKGWQQRPR